MSSEIPTLFVLGVQHTLGVFGPFLNPWNEFQDVDLEKVPRTGNMSTQRGSVDTVVVILRFVAGGVSERSLPLTSRLASRKEVQHVVGSFPAPPTLLTRQFITHVQNKKFRLRFVYFIGNKMRVKGCLCGDRTPIFSYKFRESVKKKLYSRHKLCIVSSTSCRVTTSSLRRYPGTMS